MRQTRVRPVHLLSVGNFGTAIGEYLRAFRTDIVETVAADEALLADAWPDARIRLVAAWRPVPHLCELLDERCYGEQRPFVPVIMDSTVLQLGPIIVPRGGSCWSCWVRRCRQHSSWSQAQAALLEHYASNPNSGPQGYLEPFALLAAARIVENIDALDSSTAIPGYIWQIDVLTRRETTGTMVGVHDCRRCGLQRLAATRGFVAMEQELSYLWKRNHLTEPS
jgi:bacteriocin biosynthesis cyclodehydratase domain-containing protein